jgi:hypothetical protein
VLVPLPVVVTDPGVRVSVHVPVDGSPFNTTLPVATVHVGAVIVPTTGADGVAGCAGINTLEEKTEIQPASLVTV